MIRALIAGLAVLALLWPATVAAKPTVWRIRDADSTILIFGSIHVLPAGLDWMPEEVAAALTEADDLWFEISMDGAADAEASRETMARGLLPAGQVLSERLPPDTNARLSRLTERLGLYAPGLQRMRPWLAELTLVLAVHNRLGALAEHGVERRVHAQAPPHVTRRAFETAAQQIAILAQASEAEQIAALDDTMMELENEDYPIHGIIAAWMAGDAEALEDVALDSMREDFPRLYDRLIVVRNAAWTQTIANRLSGRGVTVIVVGAGHLVGPHSVPAMLRARGIAVEGP